MRRTAATSARPSCGRRCCRWRGRADSTRWPPRRTRATVRAAAARAVRLFLAINLEPAVRRAVIEATSQLRDAAPTLSWVDESRLHLTLKFLGEQPPDVVTPLAKSLDEVAARH